jgi:hypothetical protein
MRMRVRAMKGWLLWMIRCAVGDYKLRGIGFALERSWRLWEDSVSLSRPSYRSEADTP